MKDELLTLEPDNQPLAEMVRSGAPPEWITDTLHPISEEEAWQLLKKHWLAWLTGKLF